MPYAGCWALWTSTLPRERVPPRCTTLPAPRQSTHDRVLPDFGSQPQPVTVIGRLDFATLALAALIAVGLTAPAGASERWFTVEIIVFDDLRDEGLHAEHWPVDPDSPSLRGAIELSPPQDDAGDEVVHAFRLVDRSELSLVPVWNSLGRSAHYRPLLHAGWRLPGFAPGAARPAHVSLNLDDRSVLRDDSGERPDVHGTVKVSLNRYLLVEVDLLYRRTATEEVAGPEDAGPARFRLVAERRMRSRELHYIDHPVFGMLVWITPFEATVPSESDA